ncbi:adenylate/guanylate cyclase domain-containing protein [Marimonas sp. MJW-29]|uniref:Adenylate/guanylate cyclase domain-containing protein n=1 Tax=Sulfitobacter sediminis TaxID=3234186 RepID=A0ABV3RQS4_9RHOB
MAAAERIDGKKQPLWLAWYLNYGLEAKPPRRRTRQYIANLFGAWGSAQTIGFTLLHVFLGLDQFWAMALINVVMTVTLFCLPFAFNRGDEFGAFYIVMAICPALITISALAGNGTGVQLTLLSAPAVSLLIIGPKRPDLLMLITIAAIASIIVSEVYFSTPIVEAYRAPIFQIGNYIFLITATAAMIVVPTFVAFNRAETAEDALAAEHARSEALLYNLLPEDIAARLKVEPNQTIADSLPKVAILFADIVDFTPRAASLPPEEVVSFLNKVFRAFDELAEKHGLEKIKTIGDAYMVAAGMPNPCGDPVHRVAEMALDMQRTVADMADEFPEGLEVRIGLHAGPAVAGVIGNKKLFYDVWGETVNTASRMESHGEPGRIQVTGPAHEELAGDYSFEPRGTVEVKGMGSVETWWLAGKAA